MRPRSREPDASPTGERGLYRAPTASARTLAPLMVRFVEQTDTTYTVGELRGPRTAQVPKQRAIADTFPPVALQHTQARARRLLRWSLYALLGACAGGVVGIVLGFAVVVVAFLRLANFSGKVRRWRHAQRTHGERGQLPAAATSERLCLLAALGQGMLAVGLGVLVLLLLVGIR